MKWETDVMRRSWASYLYNFDKKRSMAQIARVAGNSARILDKHYVQNLPDGEGKRYFSIGGPLKAGGGGLSVWRPVTLDAYVKKASMREDDGGVPLP